MSLAEIIQGLPLVNLSAVGALTIVFFLVIGGKLVPASRVKEIREDRDARLKEVGLWRDAAMQYAEVVQELTRQNSRLMEIGEVGVHVLTTLPKVLPEKAESQSPEKGSDNA